MTATVFLVLLLSAYWIKKRSIEAAVLDIFLPAFIFLPAYYAFRIPHLPSLNYPSAALIPIVIVMLIRHGKEWKFTRSDLWVVLFMGGATLTEVLHSDPGTAGLVFFDGLFEGVMPYMLAKLLLEKDGLREKFVRRMVYLTAFIAVVSVWEYRMGSNLFARAEGMVLGNIPIVAQIRGGLVRVSATFAGCIQAGTVFGTAFIFSIWLAVADKAKANEPKYLGVRRSTLITVATFAGLFMANSRGPELGAILGFLVARIGKVKNMRMTAIVTVLLIAIAGAIGYVKGEQYTRGTIEDAKTIEQEDAIYRRILLDEYKPYIAEGGLLGYGIVARPVVPGMFSIDNAFLNVQLLQGNLGLWTLILMGAETLLAAFLAARRATQRTDICFAMCIGGQMAGLLLTLGTVWMGPPMYSLFFLLLGWSQSLRQTEFATVMAPQPINARFSFRRVIA
ncbi:MAG: hypothetical protein JOZ33_16000 [Acidobacteriaceae bacterium]|nr:hypothetical protein [Acidobacteriaceae bacterium]